ncbi:MAG: adenine deaminase [Prevotella sp.]|nr:adenine deaminase [Paraprevotella sp.]MDD7692214.1 adenine deaminase [Prevotella sp.]MDY4408829.1 adenine deaminase [Prevotella sp.]
MRIRNILFCFVLTFIVAGCGTSADSKQSILLKNGNIVDSETGAISQADILIKDGRIAFIGNANNSNEKADTTIDCTTNIVTAGFIDSHVHIESSMVLPETFGEAVLPHGTTTVIADPHEIVNVAGAEGLRRFLEEARRARLTIYTVIPSCVPATPYDTNGAGNFTAEQMKEFADKPDIVGLGEVMSFYDVVADEPSMKAKLNLFKGKTIDGHTAGMADSLLDAYIKHGISNDHECYDDDGVLKRYERGMNIYIREGSAARNAKTILECIKKNNLDVSRFGFCTDDKHLATIEKEGHISHIVRMALAEGFTWGEVARMASYNPCKYYNLKQRGNIKEGYVADIVITDNSCKQIKCVIKDGKIINGKERNDVSESTDRHFDNTVKFRDLTEDDFSLSEVAKTVAIKIIEGQLLTEKKILGKDEWKGLNLLATIERYGKNGNISVCPVIGYGIKDGAVATSVSHDSHNVICAGDNAKDMAVACNRLKDIGGGYVIVSGGHVTGEFALPFCGLMSPKGVKQTIEGIADMEKKARLLGVNKGIDPFITLSFLALPVIPDIRLLDTGLFDVTSGQFIFNHEKQK